MVTAGKVLGKEDAFLKDHHTFWAISAVFPRRAILEQGQTCSLLMATALEHRISCFPLQQLCTLRIFFFFDFPFLSGKEEAKTVYCSLCS